MRRPSLLLEDLIDSVIGAFFEVYNTLGYGFLEHLYLKGLSSASCWHAGTRWLARSGSL